MDAATLGLVGGIAGTLIGIVGAVIGCRASYRAASGDAERAFLRRIYRWMALGGAVFVALVWTTSLGLLPRWIYWATIAVALLPLGLWIRWVNRRLAELKKSEAE